MANLCSFEMIAIGTKENMKKFIDALSQEGPIWMGRGAAVYVNDDNNLEYSIEESLNKDSIMYIDNEGYDNYKETYGEYELVVYRDQTSPRIIVYMEKEGTFIAINGHLSMDQIHRIIDSFVIDDSI